MKNVTQDLNENINSLLDTSLGEGAAEAGAMGGAQRFEMVDASDMHDDQALVGAWHEMLSRGTGPEKLYQTPEFFRFMREGEEGQSRSHALYVVRRRSDGASVGIVPVRRSEHEVAFALGRIKLVRRKVLALQVLGSVPLLDRNEPGLDSFVFGDLLARYPDCSVLSMQAVPSEKLLALGTLAGLSAYIQNGLRECHTVPLPENFDAYLQKFSSKKRYNLTRQVRLLREQAGEVQVCRVDAPDQVQGLIDAMHTVLTTQQFALLAQQERFERLARHGLLHSYVIRCGAENVAVVIGTRSVDVWHVHNIVALAKYSGLSVGTSAVHLALQDVITHFSFSDADFGYGMPNQEFRSTHVLKARATVLVCRSRSATALLLATQEVYQRATNLLLARVRHAQHRLKQRRQAARQKPAANA
jgi:hypothetical protein